MCTSKGICSEKLFKHLSYCCNLCIYSRRMQFCLDEARGGVLCGVHCEWIIPTINWASAHRHWGLAVNIEESTFPTTAYEHFPKLFHSVLLFASKRNQRHQFWPWFLNWLRHLWGWLQGISLMFSEILNNFSLFWMTRLSSKGYACMWNVSSV